MGPAIQWERRLPESLLQMSRRHLLRSFFWSVPKVNHVLASVCEKLLAKALEVPVYERQDACRPRVATHIL